ncbi:hypothetical protein [Arthrobacter cupressi]|uniref:Uncharacterized protein n=1 Tax=Arthrobacter cupressi TaxID=1045773 RepID=A0A1G8LJP2_9MICC|nr:hypothetical protein [Arthrobacter cupressi]NYD77602.1 antibiotic biosynthesis monooxygenase (ABM) superfamily enzyme [Arthrobacter cupressi]SDI55896.1 hypothetical protein SAMN05216555_10386 [Arthrobacter cupressi]
MSPSPAQQAAAQNGPAAAPPLPSIHVRAFITWLAIFPLVAVGLVAFGPLMESWHPVLRAFFLTVLIVPAAVYFVVPKLFAMYGMFAKRRAQSTARKQA